MKTYVATDRLNPNAINARYGRPAKDCDRQQVAIWFHAKDDEEAISRFIEAIDGGWVGYSDLNTTRIEPRLYRSKDWYRKGQDARQVG
jgi:hypothetical protein